ncbi:glycoside hydrolase family 43 protein [Halopelagius fulvigenes]|uniref:Glycoside hydrolase family 43 protein n=1 Tax=Halopelagius fulvigenes TaxID=1198324 RepID=A0ABD5U215_9EURY
MEFLNPVLPGCYPDPTVCRVGRDYYLATSSFEYFPGVPLFHSRNLVDWEPIGYALTRDEQLSVRDASASEGIFAPTLRHRDGTFYLVTTNVGGDGHFVVTADDPRGEWSDPTWIDAPGFDPDLFWDGDDAYLTYAHDSVVEQTTVDVETGETDERRTLWTGTEGDFTEAPHLYAVDGSYYLVLAEGGTHTGHMVVVARADAPTGPFRENPENPVLSHRAEIHHPIQATGHADFVRAHDGTWWAICLGVRQHGDHPGYHHLGRETFLAPVRWEDGWPVVNGDDPLGRLVRRSDTALEATGGRSWTATRDAFADDGLGVEWNYRRNPHRDRYAVQDGTLVLRGGPETLDEKRPTFVGRRQQQFDCQAETRLDFDPSGDEEAGFTVGIDEEHHFDLAVTERTGDRIALTRLRIGDATETIATTTLGAGPVTLAVEADRHEYRFAAVADGRRRSMGSARSKYLSTEVAGGFTGVFIGLYATGNGSPAETPARFRSFRYRPAGE